MGDSKKEIDLDIAEGFTERVLADDEIMVPEAFHEYLGFAESPQAAFEKNLSQVVNMTFDFSSHFAPDDSGQSRGERFVKNLGLPVDVTFPQIVETSPQIGSVWNSKGLAKTR